MELILDYLLENYLVLYTTLIIVLLLSFAIFYKINRMALFIVVLFISLKLVLIGKLDDYMDSRKKLVKKHYITVTVLVSLIVSVPAVVLFYLISKNYSNVTLKNAL